MALVKATPERAIAVALAEVGFLAGAPMVFEAGMTYNYTAYYWND